MAGFATALIPAVGSLLGGIFGGGGGKAQPPAHGQIGGTYNQLINTQANTSGAGTNFLNLGQNLLGQAPQAFTPALNYYTSILSGNPSAVGQALTPETTAIASGIANQRRTLDQFAPMGGGRSNTLAQLPYQQTGLISNLISNARNQAAAALPGLGSALAGAGTMSGGLGNSLYNTANQAGAILLGQMYPQQSMAGQQGAALGGGIYDILNQINWGKVFGGGGGSYNGV